MCMPEQGRGGGGSGSREHGIHVVLQSNNLNIPLLKAAA